MLTPDLLRRIRRIELKTRRLVANRFAGAYHSVYKGRGLSFLRVRPYEPGDDIRSIDWKVTARTGETHIKVFTEERELSVLIVVDGSASVLFGTQEQSKRDFAGELGAVLAYTALLNNDKAGLIIFTNHIEHHLPTRRGEKNILRLIRDLLTFEPKIKQTHIGKSLATIHRMITSGTILFVISDFLAPADTYRRELAMLAQKHDVIPVILQDALESTIPNVGILGVSDLETGDVQFVDTSSDQWQEEFKKQRAKIEQERNEAFTFAGIEPLKIPPDGNYTRALQHYFQQQIRKR